MLKHAWLDTLMHLGFLLLTWWSAHRYIASYETHIVDLIDQKPWARSHHHARKLQLWRIALFIVAVLIGLQILGMPMSALLAFGGIGGVGFAFAAKIFWPIFLVGL